jgi:hypothetical protein
MDKRVDNSREICKEKKMKNITKMLILFIGLFVSNYVHAISSKCSDYCINEAKIGGYKCEGMLETDPEKGCIFKDQPFPEGVYGSLIIPPSDFKYPEDEKKALDLCSQKCKEQDFVLTTGPQGIKYGYRPPMAGLVRPMPINLMCYCKKG